MFGPGPGPGPGPGRDGSVGVSAGRSGLHRGALHLRGSAAAVRARYRSRIVRAPGEQVRLQVQQKR